LNPLVTALDHVVLHQEKKKSTTSKISPDLRIAKKGGGDEFLSPESVVSAGKPRSHKCSVPKDLYNKRGRKKESSKHYAQS